MDNYVMCFISAAHSLPEDTSVVAKTLREPAKSASRPHKYYPKLFLAYSFSAYVVGHIYI